MGTHVGNGRTVLLTTLLVLVFALIAPIPAFGESPEVPPTVADDDDDDDEFDALVWINDVEVNEAGDTATFTINKLGKTKKRIEIDVATADIEAKAGRDYEEQKGTITLPKRRVASATFTVPIIDDAIDENRETFAVILTASSSVLISKDVGIGTIVDNDKAGVRVDTADGVFLEEGSTDDSITIELLSEPTDDVVINVVVDNTQLASNPSQVVFGPSNWNQKRLVTLSALADGLAEDDPHESEVDFSVTSSDRKYRGVEIDSITATIADVNVLDVLILGPTAGLPDRAVAFSAELDAQGSEPLSYEWTVFFNGNPIASGNEQDFTFTPSQPGIYIVQVTVAEDSLDYPSDFVQLKVLGDIQSSVFVDDILWLANEGITRGCNPPHNDMFCPEKPITRGQMAAFLVRFLGLTDDGAGDRFTDDDDSIFEDEINILAAAGVTNGCNPPESTKFCPDDLMTRGQMAGFLSRALGLTDDGGGDLFTDDDIWIFEPDIDKLATAGITKGCNPPENTKYCPGDHVTRGQMAAFLRRADGISG